MTANRSKQVTVFLTPDEHKLLKAFAEFKDMTQSAVLREYVKTLPDYTNLIFKFDHELY